MKLHLTICLILAFTLPFSQNNYAQTVRKNVFSSFHISTSNDSVRTVAGQVVSGKSDLPNVYHGYLPLKNSILSIAETVMDSLIIFPNPFQENVTIQWYANAHGKSNIEVYSSGGEKVYTGNVINGIKELNLGVLSSGFYYFILTDEAGNTYRNKLIKQ